MTAKNGLETSKPQVSLKDLTARVLGQALVQPAQPANTMEAYKKGLRARILTWNWTFEVFGEDELKRFRARVLTWCDQVCLGRHMFLTVMGRSGIGKSLLTKRAIAFLEDELTRQWRLDLNIALSTVPGNNPNSMPTCCCVYWPHACRIARDGNWGYIQELSTKDVLLIDDFGSGKNTDFPVTEFCDLLERRQKKPTLITTNLTPEDIQALDPRIWDRLIRHNGSVFSIENTISYSERT